MVKIDIHADDYGISDHSAGDMLDCLRAGKLDSISVLTNMSGYEKWADRLNEEWERLPKKPKLTVHLNFMEGRCLAEKEKLNLLVNEKGFFCIGWGTLFQYNYIPWKYRAAKEQLKLEIKAQTEAFIRKFGIGDGLRFDGHQHTQMIPIVYRALLEVVEEEKYPLAYVRVTKEPILPYLRCPDLYRTYSPVNWIKNWILNFYSPGLERKLRDVCMPKMLLWGVLMSGNMDEARVKKLLPKMKRTAEKKQRVLEILFHPGSVQEEELTEEFSNAGANPFHISKGRAVEKEAVMQFSEVK